MQPTVFRISHRQARMNAHEETAPHSLPALGSRQPVHTARPATIIRCAFHFSMLSSSSICQFLLRLPSEQTLHPCPQPQSVWQINEKIGCDQKAGIIPAIVASNGLAQLSLVVAGVGPALMPRWLAEPALRSGSLVQLLSNYTINPLGFTGTAWLLYPNRSFLPAKTRIFIDFLKRQIP
jgi:DNA-binding transcriptional LysR family regulator